MGPEVALIATVASTAFSAYNQIQAGNAAQAEANAQAAAANNTALQQDMQAGQERALAQREFIEEQRQKRLAQSSATARAAAGGGDTLDGSVVSILGDLEEEGNYNARTRLYEGEVRATDLEYAADLNRHGAAATKAAGKTRKKSAYIGAASTAFSGTASGIGSYGKATGTMGYG